MEKESVTPKNVFALSGPVMMPSHISRLGSLSATKKKETYSPVEVDAMRRHTEGSRLPKKSKRTKKKIELKCSEKNLKIESPVK